MSNSKMTEMQQEIFEYMQTLQTAAERGEQPDLSKRQEFLDSIVNKWTQTLQKRAEETFGITKAKSENSKKSRHQGMISNKSLQEYIIPSNHCTRSRPN